MNYKIGDKIRILTPTEVEDIYNINNLNDEKQYKYQNLKGIIMDKGSEGGVFLIKFHNNEEKYLHLFRFEKFKQRLRIKDKYFEL